jgi:sugar lactone lactonase YvrE
MWRAQCIVLAALLAAGCRNGGSEADGSVIDVPGEPDAPGSGADAGDLPDAGPQPDVAPMGDGVSTLAGSSTPGEADGPRSVATFNNPVNVMVLDSGDVIVADYDSGLLRRVTPDGDVSTMTEQQGFYRPFGLAVGPSETLYVQTDWSSSAVSTGALWSVTLETGAATLLVDDVGRPRGLAVLSDGRLVLSDQIHHTIRIYDPDTETITPLAGMHDVPGWVDATGSAARFNRPYDAIALPDDTVLVADRENHRLRIVALDGTVTTWAGDGAAATADGPVASASFNAPQGLARDAAGVIYVSEVGGNVIRRIEAGTVTTVAGDGTQGFADAEDPLDARFFGLEGLDVTPDGGFVYIADGNRGEGEPYHRIRRWKIDE